jgi:CspA family cold shock protein
MVKHEKFPSIPCTKCGVPLEPYWLKDGVCNGCRNPHLIVRARVKATVKWFNDSKGYGFVEFANGSPDAFIHYSALEGNHLPPPSGYGLEVNTELEVEVVTGPKGPQVSYARRVK